MKEELEQPCPMILQVQRLFDAELPEEQINIVRSHSKTCPICREFHAAFEKTSERLSQIPQPDERWHRELTESITREQADDLRFLRRLSAVAAVLVVGLTGLVITLSSPTTSVTTEASPFAALDQWSQYGSRSDNELAGVMIRELSETNQ